MAYIALISKWYHQASTSWKGKRVAHEKSNWCLKECWKRAL